MLNILEHKKSKNNSKLLLNKKENYSKKGEDFTTKVNLSNENIIFYPFSTKE